MEAQKIDSAQSFKDFLRGLPKPDLSDPTQISIIRPISRENAMLLNKEQLIEYNSSQKTVEQILDGWHWVVMADLHTGGQKNVYMPKRFGGLPEGTPFEVKDGYNPQRPSNHTQLEIVSDHYATRSDIDAHENAEYIRPISQQIKSYVSSPNPTDANTESLASIRQNGAANVSNIQEAEIMQSAEIVSDQKKLETEKMTKKVMTYVGIVAVLGLLGFIISKVK